jgi:hypothetical protein
VLSALGSRTGLKEDRVVGSFGFAVSIRVQFTNHLSLDVLKIY